MRPLLCLFCFVLLAPRAHSQACVEDVRALVDETFPSIEAEDVLISRDGRSHVGIGYPAPGADRVMFRWSTETGLVTRGPVPPVFALEEISPNGAFVLANVYFVGLPALRWEPSTGDLLEIGAPSETDRFVPTAITNGGAVFGNTLTDSDFSGSYRWTPGGFTLVSDTYLVLDASDDGAVLLGYEEASSSRPPYLRRNGTWQAISGFPPDAVAVTVRDLSDNGQYVTGGFQRADGTTKAFRWAGGTAAVMLGWTPGGFDGGSFAGSDGTVLGARSAPPDFDTEYVRWRGSTVQTLDDVVAAAGLDPLAVWDVLGNDTEVSGDGRVLSHSRAIRLDGGCAVGLASSIPDVVQGGTSFPVTWIPSGLSPSEVVTVSWSQDGSTFTEVGSAPAVGTGQTAGFGLYWWTVPNVEADAAYLRLSTLSEIETMGPFAIEPDLTLEASWVGTIPYPYTEPDAWSTGEVPTDGYTVRFRDPGAQYASVVTFFEDATARSAYVDDLTSFDLNTYTYTLSLPGTLAIGNEAGLRASLSVQNGALAVGDVHLGLAPSPSRAHLDIAGGGTTLTAGLMTVSRSDSARVDVGTGSTATLRDGLWVGEGSGSDGEVDVSGGTLQVTEGGLGTLIGDEGRGALWVSEGGVLSLVGPVDVGASAGSSGLLTLTDGASGATLGSLRVGTAGTGGLEVTAGATLQSHSVGLGTEAGGLGTALVHGAGSRWDVTGPMQVGGEGAALFQLQDGATFCKHDASTYTIGPQGTVQIVGEVVIGLDVCLDTKAATAGGAVLAVQALYLAEGATLEADAVRLEPGGTLGGDGALALPLTNGGILAPGGPGTAGVLTLGGGYAQTASATLAVDLGGTTPGSGHDQLAVAGTAALGGTLAVALVDGYVPTVGDTYTVLAAGGVTGSFASIDLPEGIEAEVTVSASAVTLTVTGVTVDAESAPAPVLALTIAPNPVRGSVRLGYTLAEEGEVQVAIYDALGREVMLLLGGLRPAGEHEITADLAGLTVGVYLLHLRTEAGTLARQFTVVR